MRWRDGSPCLRTRGLEKKSSDWLRNMESSVSRGCLWRGRVRARSLHNESLVFGSINRILYAIRERGPADNAPNRLTIRHHRITKSEAVMDAKTKVRENRLRRIA